MRWLSSQRTAANVPYALACGLVLTIALSSTMSIQAEDLPERGEFEGVYHRDRWGVGHFAFYYVAPNLHQKLKPLEGKRIRLEVQRARQPINPGPAMVYEIGAIISVPELPMDIEIEPKPVIAQGKESVEFLCRLHNRGDHPIDFSIKDAFLQLRHAGRVENGNEPSFFFNDYTRPQMAVHDRTIQWLNGCFVVPANAKSQLGEGHHVRLQPNEKFPLVVRATLSDGEYEIRASVRGRFAGQTLVAEKWVALDVPVKNAGERSNRRDRERAAATTGVLRIDQVQVERDKEWYRVAFRLFAVDDAAPTLVLCTRGKVPIISGTLRAFDGAGKPIELYIKHRYDCSNWGEPWKVTPVPSAGVPTQIQFKAWSMNSEPIRSIRVEVLTGSGLEEFEIKT